MNKKINLDRSILNEIYHKNKDFIIPLLSFIASLIIIVVFILPQIKTFLNLKSQEKKIKKEISIVQKNIDFISNMDDSEVNSNFDLVSLSLPTEKDFISIIKTLASSSNNSGVVLQDYKFTVGNLSSDSKTAEDFTEIDLTVGGSMESVKSFLIELSRRFPLSETVSLETSEKSSTITINFYSRPYSKASFNPQQPIELRSSNQRKMLETLSSWRDKEEDNSILREESVESSDLLE